jgi:hemoglobin-like flavoprotein
MSLTAQQISLVQKSFAKVALISPQISEIFYHKLFDLDPKLKPLFKDNMSEQQEMLMAMLATAVGLLKNQNKLTFILQDLAKRHLHYGVKPEHYILAGSALLYTLEAGLHDDFTDETRDAWIATYRLMSEIMKAAAYSRST